MADFSIGFKLKLHALSSPRQSIQPKLLMVNGANEIAVRGSIWESVFIVGAGAPGGVRLPWAKVES
jgi:hypothetical protein